MSGNRTKNRSGLLRALDGCATSIHPLAGKAYNGFQRWERLRSGTEKVDSDGEVRIGVIDEGEYRKGDFARVSLECLNRHGIFIGPTGSGKSNFVRIVADEAMNHVPVWIFDLKKDHLNAFPHRDVRVIPLNRLRINPIEPPPGVPFRDWLEISPEVFAHSFVLTNVSKGVFVRLVQLITEMFERRREGLYPSVYELRLAVTEMKPRSYKDRIQIDYFVRIEDRLNTMLSSKLGEVFACYKGHNLAELLERNVVFDCSGASSQTLEYIIELILMYVFMYRLCRGPEETLKHLTILEEAETIFGTGKLQTLNQSPIDKIVRMIRGGGEGLLAANQTYLSLSEVLRSNVSLQVMMGASNARERSAMGQSMGLKSEQWETAMELQAEDALVSIEGRRPFHIKIPLYRMKNGGTQIAQLYDPTREMNHVPIDESFKNKVIGSILGGSTAKPKTMAERMSDSVDNLEKKITDLLVDIARNPFLRLTDRLGLYGNSRSELEKLKSTALNERGLLREFRIKLSPGRGTGASYLELTRSGYDLLVNKGMWPDKKPYYAGKSGYLHALVINSLVPAFQGKGYVTAIEGIDKGYDCDLGLLNADGKKEIAIELSLTTSVEDELKNIQRNIASGWAKIWVVCLAILKVSENVFSEDAKASQRKSKTFADRFATLLSLPEYGKVSVKSFQEIRRKL